MWFWAVFLCTLHFSVGNLPQPIDLSYGFDENTINFPGGIPFRYQSQFAGKDKNGVFYSSNEFETAEHCGTHLDAPYHFSPDGWKVGDIPLDRLITTGFLVNVSNEVHDNPNYTLPVSKLIEWEQEKGPIPEKSVLLVSFGWGSRYPNRKTYLGPTDDHLMYPGLSVEASEWIVNSTKIVGVGVDTPSIDFGVTQDYKVHQNILKANIYALENVNLSTTLPPTFNIVVMPMKLVNGTGAPARIIAL